MSKLEKRLIRSAKEARGIAQGRQATSYRIHPPVILSYSRSAWRNEGRLRAWITMELVLIFGIILTATGILVGLYLPVLASHLQRRKKFVCTRL